MHEERSGNTVHPRSHLIGMVSCKVNIKIWKHGNDSQFSPLYYHGNISTVIDQIKFEGTRLILNPCISHIFISQ